LFQHVGRTIALLRELRGKSQAQLAREAGIGKSQLSKYENGKELPRLNSLEKVLGVLGVGAMDFFHMLALVNERASSLDLPAGQGGARIPVPVPGNSLLSAEAEESFTKIFAVLLDLHRMFYEESLFPRMPEPRAGGPGGPEALEGEASQGSYREVREV
jgi:transcriptional regulator with XRE-family HTH domain